MSTAMQASTFPAPTLGNLDHLSVGKRTRLAHMLYDHGPGNGTLMVLPLDQGLEHGPTDFFPHPPARDPAYQFELAEAGNFSAIALGIGLAEKYMTRHAGKIPLILKLNGKTNIPDDADATSPLFASVEDAVRLGADCAGYTLYVGSPRQDQEIRQLRQVRADCERFGMPLMVWSYPRGAAIDAKGGKNTLYAQDYAARVALEMGADLVKLHEPTADRANVPEPYASLDEDTPTRTRRVVCSAGRTMVLFSGGVKNDDDDAVVAQVTRYMQSGATGVMFGRNMWLRPFDDAVALTRRVHEIMRQHSR
ncbi:MAG TPA: fructose-bisphosphate aldolase [Rhodanobacteraceae bacterium]